MQLALPASYVEIEQEEMMYLDGGVIVKAHLWGLSLTMSRAESIKAQYVFGQVQVAGYGAATVAALLAGIFAIPSAGLASALAGLGGVVAVSLGMYAHLIKNSLKHHTTSKGVVLNFSLGVFWSKGR